MSATNPLPSVVDIVENSDGKYSYKHEALRQILTQESVKNSPIAVYSIFGTSGSGKSYLLNIFAHFLREKYSTVSKNHREVENQVFEKLFESRNAITSTTKGIRMTTKPFWIHKEKKSVAVFLMDVEGSHATKQCFGDESLLFAFSNILSSFQIINCSNKIDRHLIEELGTFANLRSNFQGISGSTMLMLLVRDWQRPQFDCGLTGGNEYTRQLLLDTMDPMQQLKKLYESIQCFLLPHPGRAVANTTTNNLRDLDDVALKQISDLFELLFSNEKLVLKIFDGEEINGERLLEQLDMFDFNALLSDSKKIKNVFEEVQEKISLKTIETSVQRYRFIMAKKVVNEEEGDFAAAHDEAKEVAMAYFRRLSEQQRNIFQPKLDKKLLEENMILAENISDKSVREFTEEVEKIGKFFPGKVNESYKKHGKLCLFKLKTFLGDGEQFKEAKDRIVQNLDEKRKIEFAGRRKFKRGLMAVTSALIGVTGVPLFLLIPPLGVAVAASVVATELVAGGLGAIGGIVGLGAGVGIGHLATNDDKPDLVDPAVDVNNKALAVDAEDSALSGDAAAGASHLAANANDAGK